MYCVNCGKEIEENTRFCPYCGHAMLTEENDHNSLNKQIDLANEHRKSASDSQTQPTSALAIFGTAILIFVYGIVCINTAVDSNENLGMICCCISIVMWFISYRKLKKHEGKYGLNGIGYIVYLIYKILWPIVIILMIIFIAFFILMFVRIFLETRAR